LANTGSVTQSGAHARRAADSEMPRPPT
jgi:hypothetical protein